MRIAMVGLSICVLAMLAGTLGLSAQEISGFSTLDQGSFNACSFCIGSSTTYDSDEQAYIDTEEDYTASLYYDVSSDSGLFWEGDAQPLLSGSVTGNPSASGSYAVTSPVLAGTTSTCHTFAAIPPNGPTTFCDDITPGIYYELTYHIVDLFYVASVGEYYDPYGFSVLNGNGDGGYDSNYWYSIWGYATYIAEASVILGATDDASNRTSNTNLQGPTIDTTLYQEFIAPDWVYGPGITECIPDIYAGDNRTFDPSLGPFKVMQAVDVGIGGDTALNTITAPPVQATGWTFEFSPSVLVNNQIPSTAYNFDYLLQCTGSGVNDFGHASTSGMQLPEATYSGNGSTTAIYSGTAENPVPLFAYPLDWYVPLTLSEPDLYDLEAKGTLGGHCYPAKELSVGGVDVATWTPVSNSLANITLCLKGEGEIDIPFDKFISLAAQ